MRAWNIPNKVKSNLKVFKQYYLNRELHEERVMKLTTPCFPLGCELPPAYLGEGGGTMTAAACLGTATLIVSAALFPTERLEFERRDSSVWAQPGMKHFELVTF